MFGHKYRISYPDYETMDWVSHCSRCGAKEKPCYPANDAKAPAK